MDKERILAYIDSGANFYLYFFGGAPHMECIDNGFYSFIRPRHGEKGVSFVFDIKLEGLPEPVQKEKINDLCKLNIPVWPGLLTSEHLHRRITGKAYDRARPAREGGEEYMALAPENKPEYPKRPGVLIERVDSPERFTLWAELVNAVFTGGYPDIHPANHYRLCESGAILCYILYKNGKPASAASILDNNGICSLEFAATLPEFRRQGLASAVCSHAAREAFRLGAKIVTLRATDPGAVTLYESLGFESFNGALARILARRAIDEHLTPCGGGCADCGHFISGECKGCRASGGKCIKMWPGNGHTCQIYECCTEHGTLFCGLCAEFPCEWLKNKIGEWDKDGIDKLSRLKAQYEEGTDI